MKTMMANRISQLACVFGVLAVMGYVNMTEVFSQDMEQRGLGAAQPIPKENQRDWVARQRDWFSTTWDSTEVVSNSATGQLGNKTNRYTELANGLNYLAPSGRWEASEDRIESMTDTGGAAALRGPTKVYFPPSIGAGRITIITASNTVFHIQPVGLYYFDTATGKSVLLASVREVEGELLPPNQVVYRSAFEGLQCDVRYTYTKGAFESDLIILQKPKSPESYGLHSATTRFQLCHTIEGPAPAQRTPRTIPNATGNPEPALIDETIDYSELWFPQGRAFSWDSPADADTSSRGVPARVNLPGHASTANGVPVAKTLGQFGEGRALFEFVRWTDIKPKLDSLPPVDQGAQLSTPIKQASLKREVPLLPKTRQTVPKTMRTASAGYQPQGLVLDYTIISSGGTTYSFLNNTTYYISTFVSFSSTVTFYGGCVLKYANGAALYLRGNVNTSGTSQNPSILTSKDENIFGQLISGSTGSPTYSASEAIWLDYTISPQTFNGMKIRWAQVALEVSGNGSGLAHTLNQSSVQWCQTAVYASSCGVIFQNSSKCSVTTLIQAYGQNAGYTGNLTDICPGDGDNNGLADSTEYRYFGRLGTLQGHVIGQLNNRTASKNPVTDQNIFIGATSWPPNDNLNSGCWLAGMTGLSSFSPYHDWDGISTCYWYQGGGTLITPRHFITVGHMSSCFFQTPNAWVRFVDIDGVPHDARCLKKEVTSSEDICVIVLDRDMPSSVQRVKAVASDLTSKLSPGWGIYPNSALAANLAVIGCNQNKQAFILDAYSLSYGSGSSMFSQHSLWFPNWGSRQYPGPGCLSDVVGGDSGSPTYLMINNELVLIGAWEACGINANISNWAGPVANLVNGVINSLDSWVTTTYGTNAMTGYAVSLYDLSAFPNLR